MFEQLVADAIRNGGVADWARVENAACARRLSAMADMLDKRIAADGADDRDQWCIDNWDAVSAEIAAAQNVSKGVASHQLSVANALRDRLPRVDELFAAGLISYRMVETVESRTRLVGNRDVIARVDAEIAAEISAWRTLSQEKLKSSIDYFVDRHDPMAVRRTEGKSRARRVDFIDPNDGTGLVTIEVTVYTHEAKGMRDRLDAMTATVCPGDLRTREQQRVDAFVAAFNGHELSCACGDVKCLASQVAPSNVVVNVIANEESLTDDTPARLDGPQEPGPTREEMASMTIAELLRDPTPGLVASTRPSVVLGGGMLPAPVLAAKVAKSAKIRYIKHPGDAAPEPRYRPSKALEWFVRCRDMTCRAPGCDVPADRCDIDHVIPYPFGSTQASNLICLCRIHHLLKTFLGWTLDLSPDGTVIWTLPDGSTQTTYPGSRLLFPTLCKPTAPVVVRGTPVETPGRTLKMPRRTRTRAQNRAQSIEAERRRNAAYLATAHAPRVAKAAHLLGVAGDEEPPPF